MSCFAYTQMLTYLVFILGTEKAVPHINATSVQREKGFAKRPP